MLAVMTHFLAGMSAVLIKTIVKQDNNESVLGCDWYFVIFVWDSLIGVSATIAIVSDIISVFRRFGSVWVLRER